MAYATVLNSPSGNTYLYYNSINIATGDLEVRSYLISGVDADEDGIDDGISEIQEFEPRSGITIDSTAVNLGTYSGVLGVFRQGLNENGNTLFQLILLNMNPALINHIGQIIRDG